MSAQDVHALEAALPILGLSSFDASRLSPISRSALEALGRSAQLAAILVVTDPLETVAELALSAGVGGPRALALWERYHRAAIEGLRGLPVFVTSRTIASRDPAWSRTLQDFLGRHGMPAASAERLAAFGTRPAAPEVEDGATKYEGLLLASQRQLTSLLDQLVGAHDRFDPAAPEPESPWVGALLETQRDLDQVWKGLDWATRQLASFVPAAGDQPDAGATGPYPANATEDLAAYHRWLSERGEPTARPLSGGLPAARARVHLRAPPLFSVVVPVYRPPAWALERCVASVLGQTHSSFQLLLADDASRDPALEEQLRSLARLDPRVELVFRDENAGIAAATNSALEHARGKHVVFLDHDDELHPRALEKMAAAIAESPEADVLYSDEDKLSPSGERYVPTFKPDWSPDLLLSCAYLCHLLVVRRSLVEELGGLRTEFDGSQDYDLMLRATERARKVVHVPEILYHWRELEGSAAGGTGAKPWAYEAGRRAVESAAARRGFEAEVEPHERFAGNFHLRRSIVGAPLVSIVVAFRDEPETLAVCCRSLTRAPGYDNFEILLADNRSELPETTALVQELTSGPKVRLLGDLASPDGAELRCGPALNNAAAAEARGDVLLFLDPHLKARSDRWLEAMLGHAQRDDVGAAGALVRYPDLSLQHAGIVLGMSGAAGLVQRDLPFDRPSYLLTSGITRDCTALTGACIMTRRSCFEELGGFDDELDAHFSEVDYCLRLRRRGLLVVFTPLAELIRTELKSKGDAGGADPSLFRSLWRDEILRGDPYYNCNLTLLDPYCRLPTEEETDQWRAFRSMLEASSTG